jgi:hypothetical protein
VNFLLSLSADLNSGREFTSWFLSVQGRSDFFGLYECYLVAQWRTYSRAWNDFLIPVSRWKKRFLVAVRKLSCRSVKIRLNSVNHVVIPVSTRRRRLLGAVWMLSRCSGQNLVQGVKSCLHSCMYKKPFLGSVWMLYIRSVKNRLQGVKSCLDSCQYN